MVIIKNRPKNWNWIIFVQCFELNDHFSSTIQSLLALPSCMCVTIDGVLHILTEYILCVASPGGLGETELSAGLQQRHHNHLPPVFLHWCATLNLPPGGGFADLRPVRDLWGPQQSRQGGALPQRPQGRHYPSLSSSADSSCGRGKKKSQTAEDPVGKIELIYNLNFQKDE